MVNNSFQERNFIFATLREFEKLSSFSGEISLHIENVGNKSWINFSALLPSNPQKREEVLFNSATEFFRRYTLGSDSRLRFVHQRGQTWLHFSTTLSNPVGAIGTPQSPKTFQHSRIFTRSHFAKSSVKKAKSPRKRERDNASGSQFKKETISQRG